VDSQGKASEDSREPGSGALPLEGTPSVHSGATEPATAEQLKDVEQQMSSFEKATLRWAKTAVFLSVVAAGIVCAQWWEMHKGGIDTRNLSIATQRQADDADKMKDSAEKSAQASRDFADTAGRINTGIVDAVKKLDAQAVGIEKARETSLDNAKAALDAANEAMYREQRPWVGIEIVPASPAPGTIGTAPGIGLVSYAIVAHNTGKTPAIDWRAECCEYETKDHNEVVPTYSVLHADIDRHISDPMRERITKGRETLEHARDWINQTRVFEATEEFESKVIAPGGFQQVQSSIEALGNDHKFHYILGQFVYRDVLDPSKMHVTQFCVVTFGNSGSLQLCRTSNDMN
jgi:hypothetical protein